LCAGKLAEAILKSEVRMKKTEGGRKWEGEMRMEDGGFSAQVP
jgi:hypothetical protein